MSKNILLSSTYITALVLLTATTSIAAIPAPTPSPSTIASPVPSPIASIMATPAPLIRFSGRLLDLAHCYSVFSNGDAYQLASDATLTDLPTHKALQGDDITARYGVATFSADGKVTHLEISDKALPAQNPESDVRTFAVSASAPKPNPELADHHNGFTGEPVLVIFTVEVPPTTNFSDSIYLSTEASGWDPMAMKMDRVDALHFRITRTLASGTKFVYRYTRGTWRSAERQENGLEGAPRTYIVQNLDVARRRDTVYHWSDENPSGGNLPGPDAVPTPQTGRPFQFTE